MKFTAKRIYTDRIIVGADLRTATAERQEIMNSLIRLKKACMPEDIMRLGAEDINQIWREAKFRAVMFNAAISVVSRNDAFKSIHRHYTTRKDNPLKKKQSIVAISCKLIRVFFAILAKGAKYDEYSEVSHRYL